MPWIVAWFLKTIIVPEDLSGSRIGKESQEVR